jgi:hypothetical protein
MTVKQGFILGFIVGYRPQDLKDIFQLFTSWRNKQNTGAAAEHLILSPFSHEVD